MNFVYMIVNSYYYYSIIHFKFYVNLNTTEILDQ